MLELRNITKTFELPGTNEKIKALNNVSLTINDGEFVTVIGSNGSGKSTTMNILTGAYTPDEGQVLLNGVDVTKMKEHQRAKYFGRVFQDPMMGTASNMSVLENLEIAFRRGKHHSILRWGFKKENKKFFVEDLMKFNLGIEKRLSKRVGTMSGGQRQALTLLMATMRDKPTHNRIFKDYVTFSGKDPKVAKKEIEDAYNSALDDFKNQKLEIKNNKELSKKERKEAIDKAFQEFDNKVRKFDLTKQILLLDEHTAALDPKTARKVLELTDYIVKKTGLTTIMITHNMKDAIKYGNRLIMFKDGQIIYDVKGATKSKLTVEKLLNLFEE